MTLFWILGFVGLDMLMTHYAVKRAEKRGYDKGLKDGFDGGHAAGSRWLAEMEQGVDQARQEIWKEGL